jgi:hypothetical protein
MGVDIRRIQDNEITASNSRGDYTFADIPSFLAGIPFRFDAPLPGQSSYRGLRETIFGAYVQDDFKMTQRLTLNLGLRYEAITNPTEVNGKMANLLNLTDPQTTVLKDSYFSVAKKDFQPRAGFAWQLNQTGTTVVRAGFGMFHDHILPYSFVALASATPPFYTPLNDTNNSASGVSFPHDPNLANGGAVPQLSVYPTALKEPTKYSYNLTLQQQVMKNTLLEVAYIGSESHHLQRSGEWNTTVPISPGVFQPVFKQSNRFNPNFGSVTAYRFDANADYNALQVTLKRKSSSGLQYQVFYTYAKSIDTKSTISGGESRQEPNEVINFLNPGRDRGRSSFDARQNLVLSTTYPLPFKSQQRVVGAILGGWTVNGVGTFRTGEPFTARENTNRAQNGDNRWNPDRPNLKPGFSNNPTSGVTAGCTFGGVTIPAGQPLGTPERWYDPCAFSSPAPGTLGNLGRNTLTGPGLDDVDVSLAKVFKPSERINMQFRAEVFNIFNHANFYVPRYQAFASNGNKYSGSAGVINAITTPPRVIQLALKVIF